MLTLGNYSVMTAIQLLILVVATLSENLVVYSQVSYGLARQWTAHDSYSSIVLEIKHSNGSAGAQSECPANGQQPRR